MDNIALSHLVWKKPGLFEKIIKERQDTDSTKLFLDRISNNQ